MTEHAAVVVAALERDAKLLMDMYPKIFNACHQRHRHDPESGERVSAHQAQIIDHLDEADGVSLSGLASHMSVTASTMSLTISRLQRRGFVSRERDPQDGRRVLLRLTPAGARIKAESTVLEPRRVRSMLAHLDSRGRILAMQGIALLADAANREMEIRNRPQHVDWQPEE